MTQRNTLLTLCVLSLVTLLGAFIFEFGFGILPCPLCLQQRYAYYFVIFFGGFICFFNDKRFFKATLKLFAIVFILNMWLGIYHAGAEWAYWPGPTSCAGNGQASMNSVSDLLKALPTTKIIDCTAVQWRLFGLSLAGYNVLISIFAASFAFWGCKRKN